MDSSAPTGNDKKRSPQAVYTAVIAWLEGQGLIREVSPDAVRRTCRETREPVPLVLNRLGAVDDDALRRAFCEVTGYEPASPTIADSVPTDPDISALSTDFLKANRAIVLDIDRSRARVGLVDPVNPSAIGGLAFALKRPIEVAVLRARDERRVQAERALLDGADFQAEDNSAEDEKLRRTLEFDRDAPIARRVAYWLRMAVEQRASDIHVEPRPYALVVRYRIDGVLRTVAREPIENAGAILARVKVLADLDLGERRISQDGRAGIVVGGRNIDVRISIVPSVHGEAAVLRILDRGETPLDFRALGFSAPEQDMLARAIKWPHGLVLITGPTGSGKTTTLYAAMEAMREEGRKILAVEDPVEFHFDHVTQVQVAPKAGVTFASAIRAFLRQDPDVILVGEIRDTETAQAAIRAAMTGHLVLATLHAIDALRALPRLLDMGVEPFQLSACFRASLAQRLVRRLCPSCRVQRVATVEEAGEWGLAADSLVWDQRGCSECDNTGYRGRLALGESFEADDKVASAIRSDTNVVDTAQAVLSQSLRDDAVSRALSGHTTLAEVKRALAG